MVWVVFLEILRFFFFFPELSLAGAGQPAYTDRLDSQASFNYEGILQGFPRDFKDPNGIPGIRTPIGLQGSEWDSNVGVLPESLIVTRIPDIPLGSLKSHSAPSNLLGSLKSY